MRGGVVRDRPHRGFVFVEGALHTPTFWGLQSVQGLLTQSKGGVDTYEPARVRRCRDQGLAGL